MRRSLWYTPNVQADAPTSPIVYPDSDGNPVADNTLQFEWIMTIKGNLDVLVPDFVGGDLLWYPVEGDPKTRIAPDALVAFGRPKGHRGSYKQWEEDGVAPQVVWEILSPGNRPAEMEKKRRFYQRFGVKEYYVYDPDREKLEGWLRQGDLLISVDDMQGFVSPRLGIKFELTDTLHLYYPHGAPFLRFEEMDAARKTAEAEAKAAQNEVVTVRRAAEAAQNEAEAFRNEVVAVRRVAEVAQNEAEAARNRAAVLEAKLRQLGFDPNE